MLSLRALSVALVLAGPVLAQPAPVDVGEPAAPAAASPPAEPAVDPDAPDALPPPPAAPEPAAPPPRISTLRRSAAIGLALVPGIVLRGTGSYLVREPRAAKRLAVMAGIGVGAMIAGGLATGGTGGSPKVIVPAVPILIAGTGVVLSSWFADLWGAAGGARLGGVPRAPVPWSVELGSTWLRDPFRDRALGRVGGRVVLGRADLGVLGWFDAGGEAFEGVAEARIRILGAAASGRVIADGSRVVVRTAMRARTDDADRLSVVVGEIELIARLDLHRLDRALAGAFTELSTGLGVERIAYDAGVHDTGALLIGGFSWGAYLGTRGEARVFYEHRRDHLAGGLSAVRAAGFLGSFGTSADVRISGPWAIRGELEIGNGWVSTLALRYQGGPR